jgi:phage gpG-like protein
MRALARKVDAMPGQVRAAAADAVGAAFMKQLSDQFRRGVDPYDKPWAPLKSDRARNIKANKKRVAKGKSARASKVLVDTGRLAASPAFSVSNGILRVFLPVQYASYHQEGTGRIPRRQILPEDSTGGLGPRWTKAANKAVSDVAKKIVGDLAKGI